MVKIWGFFVSLVAGVTNRKRDIRTAALGCRILIKAEEEQLVSLGT